LTQTRARRGRRKRGFLFFFLPSNSSKKRKREKRRKEKICGLKIKVEREEKAPRRTSTRARRKFTPLRVRFLKRSQKERAITPALRKIRNQKPPRVYPW